MLEPMNPDSEVVYDAEIAPLMSQIIAICKAHRIPMLATFQYSNRQTEEGNAHFCTTRIPFEGEHRALAKATVAIRHGDNDGIFAFAITSAPPDGARGSGK